MNAYTLNKITTDCTRVALENTNGTIDLPTALLVAGLTIGGIALAAALIWFGVEYRFSFSELWFDIKWKLGLN